MATQRVAALIKLGLVSKRPHSSDSRRKVLEFTALGRAQYGLMMAMLEKIRGAMDALFDELGVDLAAKAVEAVQLLKARPLVDRIS